MGMELDSFDEIIEIDNSSTLLIRVIDHPWKHTLDIIQIFKSNDGIKFTSGIKFPLDRKSTYYLNAIQQFVNRHVTTSPTQTFREWANQNGDDDSLKITLPKTPPDVLRHTESSGTTNPALNLSKTRLAEITPLVEGTNQPSVVHKEKWNGSSFILDPSRLDEKIGETNFTVNDLIHAIVNNQPFSQRIDVPDKQIKLLLYYAFMGKKLITMNIEKEVMCHNIYYNYTRTGRMLKEMADKGLVEMEERVAKKKVVFVIFYGNSPVEMTQKTKKKGNEQL